MPISSTFTDIDRARAACRARADSPMQSLTSARGLRNLMVAAALCAAAVGAFAQKVKLATSMGDIVVELDAAKAPKTVANFLQYVKDGHYDGTVFHRVIDGFMIQGGGMTTSMSEKPTRAPIVLEAGNGLSNQRGTIAMARTMDPNSASSQFFINLADNARLDKGMGSDGYAVFGKVVAGQEVVDAIEKVRTGNKSGHGDVPLDDVVIQRVVEV